MSYLLDALNKSRGDDNAVASDYPPQPVMYPQGFNADQGINVYKWISIVLALVLTLIVGIFVGNRYALFSSPSLSPSQGQTVTQQPAQTQNEVPVTAAQKIVQQTIQQSNQAQVQPASQQAANPVQPQTQQQPENQGGSNQSQQQVVNNLQTTPQSNIDNASAEQVGEEMIVGYIPPQSEDSDSNAQPSNLAVDGGVSSDLLSRFNQAIKDSEGVTENYDKTEETEYALEEYLTKVPQLGQLDLAQQALVPGFTYDTHLYATDPSERRVKLNGATFIEKEWISDQIQIYEIQPQFIIFEMGHVRFSLPALTDWQEIKP